MPTISYGTPLLFIPKPSAKSFDSEPNLSTNVYYNLLDWDNTAKLLLL